jgi:phosphoenolpyruvate carboxylase
MSHQHKWSDETQEVLDTFKIIRRKTSNEALGTYIISMARCPSDILAMAVFMKEVGYRKTLPVRVLFLLINVLESNVAHRSTI